LPGVDVELLDRAIAFLGAELAGDLAMVLLAAIVAIQLQAGEQAVAVLALRRLVAGRLIALGRGARRNALGLEDAALLAGGRRDVLCLEHAALWRVIAAGAAGARRRAGWRWEHHHLVAGDRIDMAKRSD